jgi:hypothetical protein
MSCNAPAMQPFLQLQDVKSSALHVCLQQLLPALLTAQLLTQRLQVKATSMVSSSHVELLTLVLEARACTALRLLMGCQGAPLLHHRCPCSSHMMLHTCMKLLCTLLQVQGRHAACRQKRRLQQQQCSVPPVPVATRPGTLRSSLRVLKSLLPVVSQQIHGLLRPLGLIHCWHQSACCFQLSARRFVAKTKLPMCLKK